jgi:large subunit ribosomal protein L29
MKVKELRQKLKDDLKKILQDDREKMRQIRFDMSSGKVKNVREINKIKKDIARILTILNEKSHR